VIEFLCICGHEEERHSNGTPYHGKITGCVVCAVKNIHPIIHNFKPDNLKYLEQLYDIRKRT